MAVFGLSTKVSAVDKLKAKSSEAIGIFKTTVNSLKAVNEEIINEVSSVGEEIVRLNHIKSDLDTQFNENKGFIGKINEFLGATE